MFSSNITDGAIYSIGRGTAFHGVTFEAVGAAFNPSFFLDFAVLMCCVYNGLHIGN